MTAPHDQTKNGTRYAVDLGDGGPGKKPAACFRVPFGSYSVPPSNGAISGVVSTKLGTNCVYRPEWNLTHGSLLTQPSNTHEWSTGYLRYLGADLAELVVVKIERDELREKVCLLQDERNNFEERYVVLAGESSIVEDHVTRLDGEVEHFFHQVRDLVARKEALEARVAAQSVQALHTAIKAFLEIDSTSYLRLGELDLAGLRQLCLDLQVEERPQTGYPRDVEPSSAPPGS
ncbi:unnamed protein product [Lactuca saligna]|uniref:Uncharacterized protein n=1 Tax=Lactuca saligna TaxID=75948 RepID=A0AA36EAW2_LACSI|nr:unnamed protein product [Lactuca saligna]